MLDDANMKMKKSKAEKSGFQFSAKLVADGQIRHQ